MSNKHTIIKSMRSITSNRFIFENSIRSALSYAMTILSTHFVLGKIMPSSTYETLSKGAKTTIKLVSRLNNNITCAPVDPDLVFSTDDTSLYVHEGTCKVGDQWKITSKSYLDSRGSRSAYDIEKKENNHNRIKVKLTCTFSVTGAALPL